MFKEVEKLVVELRQVAKEYVDLNDKYEELEEKGYEIEDRIDETRESLIKEIEQKVEKATKVDTQTCKCCGSVLNKACINNAEVQEMEDNLFKELDNHPSILRLEESKTKIEAQHGKIEKRIDKLADTIYEYEDKIKNELSKVANHSDHGFWFNFNTNLI